VIINNSIQPTAFLYFINQDVMIDGNPGRKIIVASSSLFKVLLRVDSLQPTLLTALMKKFPELNDYDGQ